jgi:hypothetical protein
LLVSAVAVELPARAGREFPVAAPIELSELPKGRLRTQIEALPPVERGRAVTWLSSFHFTEQDLDSLHADARGGICYACRFSVPVPVDASEAEAESPEVGAAAAPVSPFPSHLIFHSRPGSPNVLYINFSGETVINTEWNSVVGRTEIPALAFSADSDYSTFSDAEQVAIKRIWQRMAEDYAPFDIDVTTQRPETFGTRTAHALITRNTDAHGDPNPHSTAGGVAYVNVFGTKSYASYRPAWIYHNNLANNESYIAEAASHEVGHNLGLSHDGRTDGVEYYGGHGSGDISWGPIMGTGYGRNVSQWCKGDYYLANNTQDDLATIAGKTAYRIDDHGNTPGTATALAFTGGTNIVSTTPENDPANANPANKGVLERNTDVDVFSFVTGNGPIKLSVNTWMMPSGTRGGNLDILLELYNATGALLATYNAGDQTSAAIQTTLSEGLYYLYVRNSGAGDPFASTPTGYTPYASLGQYFVSGYVTETTTYIVPPVAELQVTDLTEPGLFIKPFAVTYSDNVAVDVTTIDSSDIQVTGPNGYDQLAQFVALDTGGNGTPRTVTYAVTPSGGGEWLSAHNGAYAVFMRTNQVADTEEASVAAGLLGQFEVSVPVVIYAADMDADPAWTLQQDWQYGVPGYTSGGPTGGFTGAAIVGYNLSGDYPNNLSARYATTPPIDASGSASLTLRFRRWLGLRSIDSAFIHATTDGVNWELVWSSAGAGITDNGWQLVQYALPVSVAGSSSVRLRWGLSSTGQGGRPAGIGWNIDDVELHGDGALDTSPPEAALNVADLVIGGSPSHSCSVTYADDTAVRLSSLNSTNLVVTGPNGYSNLAEFVGSDLPDDGSPVTASYAIAAPAGLWVAADNGTYTVTLLEGAVQDTLNNAMPLATLGSFNVSISTNLPGRLDVFPAGTLESSGTAGGPFSPDSIAYALTNSGGSTLEWTADVDADWIDLDVVSGSLAANASATVTVSIAAVADLFAAGSYTGSVTILNATSGEGSTSRGIVLTVDPLKAFKVSVMVNNPAWGGVSPTGGVYDAGTILDVLAEPAAYYRFEEWTIDASGTNNPLTLIVETNLTVQSVFREILTTNYPTPHWWLAEYGYTNDQESAVTQIGLNGMALWESYIAGLIPTDPESRFLLGAALSGDGQDYVLSWNTASGRLYNLYYTTNLFEMFTPLSDGTNLPWTVQAFTNSLETTPRVHFYRIDVRRP